MNNKFSKILTLIAGLVGLIGFFFFIRILMVGDEAITADVDGAQGSTISPFVSFSIIVLIATAIIAVVFSIINLVKHPKVLKRSLIAVAVLALFLVVAYTMSSGDAVTNSIGDILPDGEAGSVSKWVSTGINFSMILGIIGFGAFLIDFVRSLVK